MNSKEVAKFASGVEAFHAFIHGFFWLSRTNLQVFGIRETRKWHIAGTALNAIAALLLGLYAWRPYTRHSA